MNRIQQYRRDTSIEQMTANFLDEYFWSHLSSDNIVPARWHDQEHQFAGIDVSLSSSTGKLCNFDEKCKCYGVLNQQMGVLSFECSFVNKADNVQDGWLLKDSKTDYWMFIQLSATVDDAKLLEDEQQLLAADVMWVKKTDIYQLIEQNTGIQSLEEDAAQLRDDDSLDAVIFGSKPRKRYTHGMFWLTYSKQLRERPINLVIPVDELLKLSHTRRFIITRKSFKKCK